VAKRPAQPDAESLIRQAVAAHRQGKTDKAVELATRARRLGPRADVDGAVIAAEALYRAGRIEDFDALLSSSSRLMEDPRGALLDARRLGATGRLEPARERYLELLEQKVPQHLFRMASFELVRILERLGQHAQAWDVAKEAHTRTTRPFDTASLVRAWRESAEAAASGRLRDLPRASAPVTSVALIVGMPRSGTTLVEQMLDCHPKVRGVGEHGVHGRMADSIAAEFGGWPDGVMRATTATLNHWQRVYRNEVRSQQGIGSGVWSLDKTLLPMLQPLAVAAALPGARCIGITRDARDTAASIFLSNFDPSWGWTGDIEAIREVIRAKREFIPAILAGLELPHLEVRYGELVEDPEKWARAMVEHLGLAWDDACLRPHENKRIVHTLSHDQVRRPINRDGIGRWRKYADRFDPSWDTLD